MARGLQASKRCTQVKHVEKLKSHASCCTTGQKSQVGQVVNSWLELMTQPSCEVKLQDHPVWEKLTFHIPSHPTIYIYPYNHDIQRASRENFERETLEKNKIDSSTIFT